MNKLLRPIVYHKINLLARDDESRKCCPKGLTMSPLYRVRRGPRGCGTWARVRGRGSRC
jgi:hypothetical protein